MKLAVLGGGAWGTAISISLSRRHEVALWLRDPQQARAVADTRENVRYLPGYQIPGAVTIESELASALAGCELALVATPRAALRAMLQQVAPLTSAPIAWLCKGLDGAQSLLAHQVAADILPAARPRAVLSGPSFASEVACGLPTALTFASTDAEFAARTARALHAPALRIYSSSDVVGVEVAGAVKNVIAIAAGISDALGLGYNARAALITRGLAEITRLGLRMGGSLATFMGLAGAGDLILTCTGELSRNRRVGLQLGTGTPLAEVLCGLGHVAEGVYTARAVNRLAQELKVEMPITQAVCRVMDEQVPARVAVQALLERDSKSEF